VRTPPSADCHLNTKGHVSLTTHICSPLLSSLSIKTERSAPCTSRTTLSERHKYNPFQRLMSSQAKAVPLVAPGHTRPVTHLSFSTLLDDGTYLLVSSCKDGKPMLREWTGDWIGTFIGHKGAVWCTKLSRDTTIAASGSADFTACVHSMCFRFKFI
jgi:hypothetical protein